MTLKESMVMMIAASNQLDTHPPPPMPAIARAIIRPSMEGASPHKNVPTPEKDMSQFTASSNLVVQLTEEG